VGSGRGSEADALRAQKSVDKLLHTLDTDILRAHGKLLTFLTGAWLNIEDCELAISIVWLH